VARGGRLKTLVSDIYAWFVPGNACTADGEMSTATGLLRPVTYEMLSWYHLRASESIGERTKQCAESAE